MASQKEKPEEKTEQATAKGGRRSMTPKEAEKRGLDPSVYGRAPEEE